MTTQPTFHQVYEPLLESILQSPVEELNERTGKRIRMLPGPAHFSLDLSSGELPLCGVRRMFPGTAAAEVAWFALGEQDPGFITRHCPIWDKFVEPGPEGRPIVKAAYGYRWRKHFGRDQLMEAVWALHRNPSDRRIWVQAWDPAEDGLGAEGQMNVPCPIGFTLSIVDGRLNSALFIRSSDVFVGLPYDVMGHALLMAAVRESLSDWPDHPAPTLGHMSVTLAHPHVYDVHFEMAQQAIEATRKLHADDPFPEHQPLKMPGWDLARIEGDPDGYVAHVKELAKLTTPHPFMCRPEIVQ